MKNLGRYGIVCYWVIILYIVATDEEQCSKYIDYFYSSLETLDDYEDKVKTTLDFPIDL